MTGPSQRSPSGANDPAGDGGHRPRGDETFADQVVRFFAGPPGWLAEAPVTRAFIWLNIFVFVGQLVVARRWGEPLPFEFSSRVLLSFGANYALATFREHRVESLVASCFVHGSFLHILFNMFALRNVGPLVERTAGSARMASLYLLAGISGSVASAAVGLWSDPDRVSVGASGAIFGVMGAAMVIGWRTHGFRGELTQTMFRWLVLFIAFGLLVGAYGAGLDNAAHVGGAGMGIALSAMWRRGFVYSPRARYLVFGACAAVVLATGVTVVARDLVSPYSAMRASQRFAAAQLALEQHECPEARRALGATARLVPKAAEISALRDAIDERCGPNGGAAPAWRAR